jgi:uncharacterized protein GlcG (DUF336 family)
VNPGQANTVSPPASPLPPRYGEPISLALAKRVMGAAEGEASAHQWPVTIAIVDSAGHLVALHRSDQANLGSIAVAQTKAQTAVYFRRPTKAFEEAIATGGLALRLLSVDGHCAIEGGLPLLVDGRVVGAIGVSGVQSTQDAQVAVAGLNALAT